MVVDRTTLDLRAGFARRLRAALISAFGDVSESDWAAALKRKGVKVSQQALNKWLKEKSLPGQGRWAALAKALGVSVDWLRDDSDTSDSWADITAYNQRAAAGDGSCPDDQHEATTLKFPAHQIRNRGLHARTLSTFIAAGDSMEPRIRDGDELLIDEEDTTPRDGRIYILIRDKEYLVKRLHQYGKQWFIVSDNAIDPKWARPVPMDFSEDCKILGRVRWIGSWED